MAWSLYYLGDLISKPMWISDLYAEKIHPVYNWIMLKSSDYQADYDLDGPWEEVDGDLLVATMEKAEDEKP